ncbi:MAG: alpha/beta hydrolase [Actinomycetota bacterium]|nr:alpha/beta hydrolase [Actinomycetota bacterium]
MPLDPNIAGLLQFIAGSGLPPISQSTPEQARAGLRALMVDFRDATTLAAVASVTPTTIADHLPVRVYRPEDDTDVPTIVYFHGGGFVIGDLDTHENVCRQLCRDVGAVVISVDYPLAPEFPFPAAVDSCYTAVKWVAGHIDEYGGDAARLVVGGDSAGGNLATVCAQLARADGLPLAAQLLVYPAVDLLGDYPSRTENADGYFLTLADMEWFAAQYTGITGGAAAAAADPASTALARGPRISPLLADNLADLPPAIVATAEFDPLRDEGNRYAEALAAAGVPVVHHQFDGLIHGFYGLEAISPAIADATAIINAELRKLVG